MSSSSKFINKKNFVLNHLNNNLNQFHNYLSQKFIVLKKGFTLVELSIVLLVLALLVSTLLVGRQIIDRAKVQQVVSEIDYYTKNFQMFRDQYDFLPGGLGEETCRKYPEFSMQKGDDTTKYQSQCDDPVSMLGGSATKYYTSYKQANFSMVDMVASGMIENRSPGERRRKKFDIATTTETTCISVPAVQSGYYKVKCNEPIGVVNTDIMKTCIWNTTGGYITFENNIENYRNDNFVGGRTDCNVSASSGLAMCAKDCSSASDYVEKTYGGHFYYTDYPCGKVPLPLSTYGKTLHTSAEMEQVCETKTVDGQPRFGYLLKKDEIENQANKSSFDSKTWITYTGGKVDFAIIYGIGQENVFTMAGENNIILFFHYDKDKTELTDDGAVSYDLYDLLVKKLGEKKGEETIGNIIPFTKSGGQGFNFGYIMR